MSKYVNKKHNRSISTLNEEELSQQLMKRLLGIIILITIFVLSAFFFAPKVGSIFGFLSKHRNDDNEGITPKITSPVFKDVPKATNQDKINLSGYSQIGSTIVLYVNGPEVAKTTADNKGEFSFVDIELNSPKNTIFAKSIDSKGTESEPTQNFSIIKDKDKPEIDIDSPKDGETVKNLNGRVNIIGKVNEKSEIKINDRLAILRPDLSFELLLGVDEGKTDIKIVAIDEAGNNTEKSIQIRYEKESN